MYEIIANNYILYIQKCQLTPKYSVAIKVLTEFINFLRGLPNKKPSKEEIKTTIDVIKEIEKSFAKTEEIIPVNLQKLLLIGGIKSEL